MSAISACIQKLAFNSNVYTVLLENFLFLRYNFDTSGVVKMYILGEIIIVQEVVLCWKTFVKKWLSSNDS